LVAGALPVERIVVAFDTCFVGGVDTLRDVRRLRADGDVHPARCAVEALARRVVADLEDALPHDRRNVGVSLRGHLAGDVDLAGRDERLDGNAARRVLCE
jgi:hypothetical protein